MVIMMIDELLQHLNSNHIVFGGCFNQDFIKKLVDKNISYHDFMANESVAILNSIATAEGAIMEAIKESPVNIHNAPCLVTGYGKCGKTLAKKLQGLNANVYVAARKHK